MNMQALQPATTRSQRGFTLVELVTVVVLLGVVTAVIAPRFFDNDVYVHRGYTDELAASLRYVQRIAVASGCEVRFTSTAAGYNAVQRAPAGTTCDPAGAWNLQVLRTDGTAVAGAAPATANVQPNVVIDFDAQGRVSNGAPPPIAVGAFTITVAQQTGMVTVAP